MSNNWSRVLFLKWPLWHWLEFGRCFTSSFDMIPRNRPQKTHVYHLIFKLPRLNKSHSTNIHSQKNVYLQEVDQVVIKQTKHIMRSMYHKIKTHQNTEVADLRPEIPQLNQRLWCCCWRIWMELPQGVGTLDGYGRRQVSLRLSVFSMIVGVFFTWKTKYISRI